MILDECRCFITTSRDMIARLFTLDPLEGFRPKTFAGHKEAVLNAYFSSDAKTVSSFRPQDAVVHLNLLMSRYTQ